MCFSQNGGEESSKGEGDVEGELSDMEGSQISLPRSYTLPREFKYHHPNNTARERERRVGNNKVPASRFYLPSTNSSDGMPYLNLLQLNLMKCIYIHTYLFNIFQEM